MLGDALSLSKFLGSPDLSGSLFMCSGSNAAEPRFLEWTLNMRNMIKTRRWQGTSISGVLVKVGSHDPISVQLSLKSLLCMIENVGVHTIQFSQPIIS